MDLPIAVKASARFEIYDISWRKQSDSANLAPAARFGSNRPIRFHHFDSFLVISSLPSLSENVGTL